MGKWRTIGEGVAVRDAAVTPQLGGGGAAQQAVDISGGGSARRGRRTALTARPAQPTALTARGGQAQMNIDSKPRALAYSRYLSDSELYITNWSTCSQTRINVHPEPRALAYSRYLFSESNDTCTNW